MGNAVQPYPHNRTANRYPRDRTIHTVIDAGRHLTLTSLRPMNAAGIV